MGGPVSLSDARFAWEAKAATILDVRLRARVAAFSACPATWADRVVIVSGFDSSDDIGEATRLSRVPAVDVVPVGADVVEHVSQDTLTVTYEIKATVDAADVPDTDLGRIATWLSGAAAEILAQFGPDPSDVGSAYMVTLAGLGDGLDELSHLSPRGMRATSTITVQFTSLASMGYTYTGTSSPAQPSTERGAVVPATFTVGGSNVSTLRTTTLTAATGPIAINVGSVPASSVVVYVSRPGANSTATASVVDGVATVALDGVAGAVWTILLIDATTGSVIPAVVTWS